VAGLGGRVFEVKQSELEIDDIVNGFKNLSKTLAAEGFIGTPQP
jgi:hypothetical protein